MLAYELIDRLERGGLLDQEIIEALREQLEQGTRVTPEAVAKLLVDNGQLTRFQATKLIGELRSGQYDEPAVSPEDDLTAGMDDLQISPDDEDVEVVEATLDAEPVAEVYAEPYDESGAVAAEPVDAGDMMAGGMPSTASRPRRARPKPKPQKSVWDSFKVYGFLGIIVLLLLVGFGLWYMLTRQSADEFIDQANLLYDQQNFVPAQERYLAFLDEYGDAHQYSSIARTRGVMIQLYRAETMTDPTRALELAKEKLPPIEQEPGLNDERNNLAALLVKISNNIAGAAGEASETPEKQRLLSRLEEMLELMENPNFMPSTAKAALAGKLQAVLEARDRVQRDINRNIRLDESVAAMETALENQETKQAFDIRFQLLKEFPELFDNDRVMALIRRASEIQKTLVKPSSSLPTLAESNEPENAQRSIVLVTTEGRPAFELRDEILYLQAGGSMLAFAGEDGKLLWRRYIGYGQERLPVRLDDGSGVLLSDLTNYEVQRCDGKDGVIRWRSQIGEPYSEPVAVREELYVSSQSGRLAVLDAYSGEAKWATQIPQPLEVGPGVERRSGRAYLPGDHSNLYVLNTRDGSALESYYIGHAEGTIAVPPVPLLGHLFVFENAGTDFTRVHVLRMDETGQNLQQAQAPFRLVGNVKTKPVVRDQERRVIVLTDRGQVVVCEVEPTAEREQVRIVAEQVASYDEPTSTQMAVGKSQMWVSGTRIGRYELQINTGRVVQDWFKYPADIFIGQPFEKENVLVHSRILRGTDAIRVTAAEAKSGAEIWRTDVGVPIAMLTPILGGGGYHAVTTQATLFELDRESLETGSTQGPIENPGESGVALRFEKPIVIDENRKLLVNQTGNGEIIVYDPTRAREKLRRVQLGLGQGKPSGGAVIAGKGLFIPLTNGRAVLMNWQTGGMLGSPFQPASPPEGTVNWSQPATLNSDPDQVVVADSRKSIYRLRAGEQIRELAKAELKSPFIGPTAAINDVLIATTSGPASDSLVGHNMGDLSEKFNLLLDNRVNWGPVVMEDLCVLRTADSVLRAYNDDGEQVFELTIPNGIPIADPVRVGDAMIIAGADGWLVAFDPNTGQELGMTDIGQPISSAPLGSSGRLLVPGAEGVVYITDVPSKS